MQPTFIRASRAGNRVDPGTPDVVRRAYGHATGLVFLIGAVVAALSIVAAVLLQPVTL